MKINMTVNMKEVKQTPTPRFKIGQKYAPIASKGKIVCTVTDILTTTNAKGEVVSIKYVATHDFCGQIVTDNDVCDTTIARGMINHGAY